MRACTRLVAAAALVVPLTACGGSSGADDSSSDASTELTVFAAASLEGTFTEIGTQFEDQHDDVSVTSNFAGSSDLAAQIQQGAPADVFASANTEQMDNVVAEDLVDEPENFTSNTLQIAVPPDNPAGVSALADLADPDTDVVICAPAVPSGAATERVEQASGVTIEPVSEESSVTDVLNKVTTGQAEAGMVYVTDVTEAGDAVQGISFPESEEAVNTYPIATLSEGENHDVAQEFMDFVLGETGQAVLSEAGFGRP